MLEIKKKNVVLGGLVVLLLITGYINPKWASPTTQ